MPPVVPRRVRVAVDRLDPQPGWRVLEVGCGVGVGLALLAERAGEDGHVVGLDRSATALERAEGRNAAAVADGRVSLQLAELARFRPPGEPFDAVLAVNVNAFWTGPAHEEVARIGELLAEDGVVLMVYETPEGADVGRVRAGASAAFRDAGWQVTTSTDDDLLLVTAVPRRA